MPPQIQFFLPDDATPFAAIELSGIPGTPSSAVTLHLWNQVGGATADSVLGARLLVSTLLQEALDERWIEGRVVVGLGEAATAAPTGWTPLGTAAWLPLASLAANAGLVIEFRLNVPLYVTTSVSLTFDVALDLSVYWSLGMGHSGLMSDGVLSGLYDPAANCICRAGDVTPTSTPGASVEAPYYAWIAGGIPYAIAAATLTPDATDHAGATLSSGEAYWTLYTLAVDGTRHVAKGTKASAGSAVKPATPLGEQPVAYVLRDDTAVIHSAGIVNAWQLGRMALASSPTSLTVVVAEGIALQNDVLIPFSVPHPLPLTASATNYIYLDRGLQVSTSLPDPSLRPLPLWEADTDGSGVTAVRDRRRFIGASARRRKLRFDATLAGGNNSAPELIEEVEPLLLDPERPLAVALDSPGSGNTSGVHRVDIHLLANDGTPTSIFPDAASMPQLPYNATVPVTRACAPTTLVIPAGARLRAHVDAIPSGGTAAAGATVAIGGC